MRLSSGALIAVLLPLGVCSLTRKSKDVDILGQARSRLQQQKEVLALSEAHPPQRLLGSRLLLVRLQRTPASQPLLVSCDVFRS